jgi:hypothetical protein
MPDRYWYNSNAGIMLVVVGNICGQRGQRHWSALMTGCCFRMILLRSGVLQWALEAPPW